MRNKILFCLLLLPGFYFSQAQSKHALLVGISNYDTKATGWPAINGASDARLMKNILLDQGFSENSLLSLIDAQATKQNIVAALNGLADKVRAGDIIYIHFSTHGVQLMDDDADELDQLDEAIVPFDAKWSADPGDYDKIQNGYLRDDEFGRLIEKLRMKLGTRGDILVIMDLSYSGSATRGDIVARGNKPAITTKGFKPVNTTLSKDFRDKLSLSADKTGLASYVVYSAANSDGAAYEITDHSNQKIGSFTYAFSRIMPFLESGTSYKKLFDRVNVVMSNQSEIQQPIAEGNVDREFFSGNYQVRKRYMEVVSTDSSSNTIVVGQGIMDGLTSGTVIRFYPAGTVTMDNESEIVKGKVIEADKFSAKVLVDQPVNFKPGRLWGFVSESAYRKAPPNSPMLVTGNVFTMSVGISEYPSANGLSFRNCVGDAVRYSMFFKEQFDKAGARQKYTDRLLVNDSATKEGILRVINEAISNSGADDYFVFNFSGYCLPLSDSNGKKVTWFVPFGLRSISDTNEIKEKGISLTTLKDLLQMIPANKQLFITEAGPTEFFQKEFIQALIETNPSIASLTNKNRVFIIPKTFGLDNFICSGEKIEQGPLNYYITKLDASLNMFGLFETGKSPDRIRYALTRTEINCNNFRTNYFDIFFERDYLKDLQLFLPEGLALFRGGEMEEEIKKEQKELNVKKYALVIGTDTYSASGWGNLPNALLDARRIAEELRKGFEYNVTLLENKPADSIYEAIRQLSLKLGENDQLFIYVSGHGDFDDKLMDDGFMVCSDSKAKKQDPYRNSYIAYSKLSRMINRLPAKQVLMVLDVCFGGSFDERAVRNKARGDVYDDVASLTYYGEKMKLKTRLYLSSGGKVAVPDGYAGKHSPFAHRLLQAMQERGGAQKMLTSSNLYEFVKKLPSGPVLGSFGDDDLNTEFILIAK
jgi:hypothetical protein